MFERKLIMKKKIFVLVSTLVLVFAMTACSGGSTNDSNSNSDSSSTKSEKSVVADEKDLGSVIAEDGKSMTITASNVEDDVTTELSEKSLVVGEGETIESTGSLKGGTLFMTFVGVNDPDMIGYLEVGEDGAGTLELPPDEYEVAVSTYDSPTGSIELKVVKAKK